MEQFQGNFAGRQKIQHRSESHKKSVLIVVTKIRLLKIRFSVSPSNVDPQCVGLKCSPVCGVKVFPSVWKQALRG